MGDPVDTEGNQPNTVSCANHCGRKWKVNSTVMRLPEGNGPKPSTRCTARWAERSRLGEPLRVSTRTFEGTPSRSMSKSIVVLLSIEAMGSASDLYQFCDTLLLTMFT